MIGFQLLPKLGVRFYRTCIMLCALMLVSCAPLPAPPSAQVSVATVLSPAIAIPQTATMPMTIRDVELLGVITVPNHERAFGTVIGGLSAIAYDADQGDYYFLSDDRGTPLTGPVRIYQATIDMSDGTLDEGDLVWAGMIPLLNEGGERFGSGQLDPEGLVYFEDRFFVSSEGDATARPPIAPAIIEFTATGEWVRELTLPEKFMPVADASRGVRNNRALESLTITPNGRYLISGVENALVQDGPAATVETPSPARLFTLDLQEGLQSSQPITEHVYWVEAIPVDAAQVRGDADNGLVEMIALDDAGTLLTLERSYVQGVCNTIRLYMADMRGAEVVTHIDALGEVTRPIRKERVLDFGELGASIGIAPDNLEGMALGPRLADGRQLLFVVSDNNFNPSQRTQLWALALALE